MFLGDSGDYQKDNAGGRGRSSARSGRRRRCASHAIGEYYRAATSEFADSLRKQGFSDAEIGPHAGLADTSLMLAVEPLARARRSPAEERRRDRRSAARERALGQSAVDAIVLQTVTAIRAATQRN